MRATAREQGLRLAMPSATATTINHRSAPSEVPRRGQSGWLPTAYEWGISHFVTRELCLRRASVLVLVRCLVWEACAASALRFF